MEIRGEKTKPILFCDFDGVLCFDRYWRSLPEEKYQKAQELLFTGDRTLVNDWMRGKYSAEHINRLVAEKIELSFEELWNIFVKDCETMNVTVDVLERLSCLRVKYFVILITGNMDSFSRFTEPALRLKNYFDHISNSFYEGVHKTDNDGEIFLKYADKYGVLIKDCIVFDDSKHVHRVFTKLGGTAYLVTPEQNIMFHLNSLANQL